MSTVGKSSHRSEAEFRKRAQCWANKIGVRPRQVRIQIMRRKWASCSTRGTVSFSRDLLGRPRRFWDEVIVHELVHLRIPNHGRLFRRIVSAHLAHVR
jgi:predicted metal-dependent hydrolase